MVPQGMGRPLTDRSQERDELMEEETVGWIWKMLPQKRTGTWESSSV